MGNAKSPDVLRPADFYLQSGNVGVDKKTGTPVIYDPSSYYGHNEAECIYYILVFTPKKLTQLNRAFRLRGFLVVSLNPFTRLTMNIVQSPNQLINTI